MITTSQFQERLIEYLDGELSEAERGEVEEYLRAHPEAARLEGDLALLSEAGRSIRESSYPADLLLEANRALAARLAARSSEAASSRGAVPALSGNGSPEMSGSSPAPHRRRWRPRALAAALAAAAILLAGAASQRAAIAEVASSLVQRIWVSIDGEQWGEAVHIKETVDGVDGGFFYLSKGHSIFPEEGDTIRVFLPEEGDTIRFPFFLPERDSIRVISGPPPAGKMGPGFPDVPAQSWGDVKEAVDPAIEASP